LLLRPFFLPLSAFRFPPAAFRLLPSAFCPLLAFYLLPSIWSAQAPATAASQEKRAAATDALKEVDALLKQASEITGLPVQRPVKSAVVSREQVQQYLSKRVKDTITPQELHAQELALKKFGLLPADFELETFLVKLLTEQAAGYYDSQQKQFYIADWTPVAVQRPAMVHELTHALQDQQVDLDRFLLSKELNQDEQMARGAVVEGAAILAMMQYVITRGNVKDLLQMAGGSDLSQYPVFNSAPPYLQESLMFPYTSGMLYMRWRVEKEGKAGYAAALKNPPRSTAEILHPGREPVNYDNLRPPEVSPLPAGYTLLDTEVLGEMDIRVLLKQYAGEETARRLAPAWRGLRYALYEHESRSASFLVHRSRWRDAESAAAFAEAYRKVLAAKGEKNAQVKVEADTVTVLEGVPATKAN